MAQLEGFLESVFLAIKLNRTLCIPPFYKHKTDELNEAVSSELRLDSAELANLMTICETHEIKDSPSSRKSEKLSKSGPFLGCCNRMTHINNHVILGTNTLQFIRNLFYQKIICLSFV